MLEVRVQYALPRAGLPAARTLHRAARAAWRGAGAAAVALRVVDADEGRELNEAFRGKAAPTNVLSFPAPVEPAGMMTTPYLGDMVLCAPVLAREAQQQNKPLAAHFAHMVVHGMLHLQGFDHQMPEQAKTMERIEREILAELGHPDPYAET